MTSFFAGLAALIASDNLLLASFLSSLVKGY